MKVLRIAFLIWAVSMGVFLFFYSVAPWDWIFLIVMVGGGYILFGE